LLKNKWLTTSPTLRRGFGVAQQGYAGLTH